MYIDQEWMFYTLAVIVIFAPTLILNFLEKQNDTSRKN